MIALGIPFTSGCMRTLTPRNAVVIVTALWLSAGTSSDDWRIERRALADGALIWETLGPTGGRLWYGIDVDSSGVYVGGHIDGGWRIEKRAK